MKRDATKPVISPWLVRGFTAYGWWFLRRHFHRVLLSGEMPRLDSTSPLLIYLNHPSWWDPMIAVLLADTVVRGRRHYAAIDAQALQRYSFFKKLGFFGIEPGTRRGAAAFLRTGEAVLSEPGNVLWVTAEGTFTDPRVRPVRLRQGVAHLARRLPGITVLPLALEYGYWTERLPEALVRFGTPVRLEPGASVGPWHRTLESNLESTMDQLAEDAMSRDAARFTPLLQGKAGVNFAFDLKRRLAAWSHGRQYVAEHAGVMHDVH